jgi:hypothetical protein
MGKNKPTEDSVNPNVICEERQPKGNKHGCCHEEHSWTVFDYERSLQKGEFKMQ